MNPKLKRSLDKQHNDAEVLISWVQFVFTSLLLIIYIAAPKAHGSTLDIAIIPYIVVGYLWFNLTRIYWAHKQLLNDASLSLYCFLDVALITGLIISFQYSYQSSLAISLKAPTYLYLIMFTSLRVLRFDVRYIVLMGTLSVAAMVGLTFFAYQSDATEITRNFVEYASSDRLLLGVEVEKIIVIIFTTAILSIGVHRAQKLLLKSVKDAEARRDLARFFSPDVLENIIDSPEKISPGTGKVRTASVLMLDLRSFTKMSTEMKPTEIMSLLADYQERMVKVILAHGGSIDKFMGDGILANFGAAKPSVTYAADCLRSMEAISVAMDEWNVERVAKGLPSLGYGVSSAVGQVVFGAVGDQSRLEFTTIGDAVNLTAKLEGHTKIAGAKCLTTKISYETAKRQGYVSKSTQPREIEKAKVEGVEFSVDLVVITEQLATTHITSA